MKIPMAINFAVIFGALVLLASPGKLFAQQAQATKDSFSYYASTAWTHLSDPAPVFKTTTYEQLINLFESDGTYLILFGGEWCGNTQAVIGLINEVAKEYGVKTIYNFDTKLDGATLQIRDSTSPFARYYVDLVNKYLQNIVTINDKVTNNVSYIDDDGKTVVASKLQVPFLFAYNRNAKDSRGNPAPIIASFEKMYFWEDFLTDGKLDQKKIDIYKATVRPLFDAISTKSGTKKIAKLDYINDFTFYSKIINKKAGTTILGSEDKNWVIKSTTYPEFINLLNSPGNFVILFGGTWCPNTRAVIKLVNQYAIKYGINTVYNLDWRLDGSSKALHLRDSDNPFANLYVDVVNTYFPGIVTEYQPDDNGVSYSDQDGRVVLANKLQVPYVFVYNKDHKDASGNRVPILGQIELMYEWDNIQADFKDANGVVGEHYKSYTTALDKLFGDLKKGVKGSSS